MKPIFVMSGLMLAGAAVACSKPVQSPVVDGGNAERGKVAISSYGCGSCHSIPGINNAHGLVGPPLAGIKGRAYVAGMLTNNPENIVRWIENPPALNEKTVMPNLGVTDRDARDIAEYLYEMK